MTRLLDYLITPPDAQGHRRLRPMACWLGHSDRTPWHFGPMDGDKRPKVCERCCQPFGYVLAGEMIATPLPMVVAGEPTGHAQVEPKKTRRVVSIGGRS